jgi:UDPglucose--hexose-1-phosphate uridylyltransferase
MSEFRQDIITKQWVLIAPKRAFRPEVLKFESEANPAHDPACVFCPGNESLNPDTILALPSLKNWHVRVIPNKFEALSHNSDKPFTRETADFYIRRSGIGDHEVIIMRDHDKTTAQVPEKVLELVIQTFQIRMSELLEHSEIRYVHVLENFGKLSGGSIQHPHFQIFAVPFIPNHLNDELEGGASYFRHHNACVYCDMIKREHEDGSRVVVDDKDFLVFCLYASRVPFQLRIIPKKHSASFIGITPAQRKSMARVLKQTLTLLREKLNNPAYNFYIHTIPVCTPTPAFCDPASYHWHLEVLPRIGTWAGFELGTEIYVNPVAPEDAAALLRS